MKYWDIYFHCEGCDADHAVTVQAEEVKLTQPDVIVADGRLIFLPDTVQEILEAHSFEGNVLNV